jgi:hypothetical protein
VETPHGVSWTINTPVPDDTRLDNNTGGSGLFAMVNNDAAVTETSLQTAVLDLSDAEGAVLRFSSYFFFDELETISVDFSTDGGTNWNEGWRNPDGNIHDPSRIVRDFSSFIAGQANVMLRFRFNSNGVPQGNLWQIDNIQLEVFEPTVAPGDLPGPASSPVPADAAEGLSLDTGLEWTAGVQTDSHDVYFGTVSPLGPGDFRGNQPGTVFDPGPLETNSAYFWRLDEVNAEGTIRGCTWGFTTRGELSEIIFHNDFESNGTVQ